MLAENITQTGETKLEMVTLTVHTPAFRDLVGQKIRVPVGAFVANGAIMYYRCATKRSLSWPKNAQQLLAEFWALAGFFSVFDNTTDMEIVPRTPIFSAPKGANSHVHHSARAADGQVERKRSAHGLTGGSAGALGSSA